MSDHNPIKSDTPAIAPVTIASNGSELYRVVTTTVITDVQEVFCYDETLDHIVEQHPEFGEFVVSLEHALHDTIAAPTSVLASNTALHVNSYRFVSERHTRGNSCLVVAVKHLEGTSGLLKTAYFTESPKGKVVYSEDFTDVTDE